MQEDRNRLDLLDARIPDARITELGIFSVRAANALARSNIITLRLLLEYTSDLIKDSVRNLGEQSISEIEAKLQELGYELPTKTDERSVLLRRALLRTFGLAMPHENKPATIDDVVKTVNDYGASFRHQWHSIEIVEGLRLHPYIHETEDGRYFHEIRTVTHDVGSSSSVAGDNVETRTDHSDSLVASSHSSADTSGDFLEHLRSEPAYTTGDDGRKLLLSSIWPIWLDRLQPRNADIVYLRYGISGEEPLTLEDVATQYDMTRERVRQIQAKAVGRLKGIELPWLQPLQDALLDAIERFDGLMSEQDWESYLDKESVWESDEPRPAILQLLCVVFDDASFSNRYGVATFAHVEQAHLVELEKSVKHVLRQHRDTGLSREELLPELRLRASFDLPQAVIEESFVFKAITLFEKIDIDDNGRYHLLRKTRPSSFPTSDSTWRGKPGTKLYEYEMNLRSKLVDVDWFGQLALTEADFSAMCHAIQTEAQSPNYFSKMIEAQPRLVPAALFFAIMVFSTRFVDNLPEESVDEFWAPFCRKVWDTEYSQSFYVKCKKRFDSVVAFLQQEYGFQFPGLNSNFSVVTPIFRHALIPKYMQSDFSQWIMANWSQILTPVGTWNINESFDNGHFTRRLKQFITGASTSSAATELSQDIAAAIDLYVNGNEDIDDIEALLASRPIERELWQEIAGVLRAQRPASPSPVRPGKSPLTWVWSLSDNEMALRVQDLVIIPSNELSGEPARFRWVENHNSDSTRHESALANEPWRLPTGERIISDELLFLPDFTTHVPFRDVELVLLSDVDEEIIRLPIPPLPEEEPLQFFRLTQQGAYGIPVRQAQLREGTYLVCAAEQVAFFESNDDGQSDEEELEIELDAQYRVPYPLEDLKYAWAAEINLRTPTTAIIGTERYPLVAADSEPTWQLMLAGQQPISGMLSPQIPPVFASTDVTLQIQGSTSMLPKQAFLSLNAQNDVRIRHPISELRELGCVRSVRQGIEIDLSAILPDRPDSYTLELRSATRLLLPGLQFAVIPGLQVDELTTDAIYSTLTQFQVRLRCPGSYALELSDAASESQDAGAEHVVTWHDYRNDPRLQLQFGHVKVPLVWSIPRFAVWMQPSGPYLTLDEMRQATLHAVAHPADCIDKFDVVVNGQGSRTFSLRRGRFKSGLGQLYDMVKLSHDVSTDLTVCLGNMEWQLVTVRRRPDLSRAYVSYDRVARVVRLITNWDEAWSGTVRFICRSRTNPFASDVVVGQTGNLMRQHDFPESLPDGVYQLLIELDGSLLLVDVDQFTFTTGDTEGSLLVDTELIDAVKSGNRVSEKFAEEFILLGAELAEIEHISLTPNLMYQLATIQPQALAYVTSDHLTRLWPPLARLREVSIVDEWIDRFGMLPAWILSQTPVSLKFLVRRYQLTVFPVQLSHRAARGKGYGRWSVADKDSSKDFVYVQWKPNSEVDVHVEAGLPDRLPEDWSALELDDTYGLSICLQCGRLLGSHSYSLPEEIKQQHLHLRGDLDIREINVPEEHGGHRLLAQALPQNGDTDLLDIFDAFNVHVPSSVSYLPVPTMDVQDALSNASWHDPLKKIMRELRAYSEQCRPQSPWGCAQRLQTRWEHEEQVDLFARLVTDMAFLLRVAAYAPGHYHRMLRNMRMSEAEICELFASINREYPKLVEWSLIWAELLLVHSPDPL